MKCEPLCSSLYVHDFGGKTWPPLKIIDKLKDRKREAKTEKI